MLLSKTTPNGLDFFPFHIIDIHASLIQYPICPSKSYFDEELCFCITDVSYLSTYHGVERISVKMISTSSCVIYDMMIYCVKYVSHIDKTQLILQPFNPIRPDKNSSAKMVMKEYILILHNCFMLNI